MRIGVAGIAGRMGRQVAAAIKQAGEQAGEQAGGELVGGVCLPGETPPQGARLLADIAALAASAAAIIDFTHADAVQSHAAACVQAGCAWVLGTTGLSPAQQSIVDAASRHIAVIQAANFSPGVNLVLALARQLGTALPGSAYDAEIVEMHHRQKLDAPSGTALALGEAVAAGRGVVLADVMAAPRMGHTGARREGAIGFAAVRGGQIVGEHTLIMAADDEQILLTHRAFDRASFARGAVRAALWSAGRGPGLYSMMDVLGMETTA
jgi:4-hydroxy-tetrahydrodipicolinate reductase